MRTHTYTGTLYELERMDNTKSGNPRWRLHFLHRAYMTAPDTAIASAIDYDALASKVVTLTLNSHDQVVGIEVVT